MAVKNKIAKRNQAALDVVATERSTLRSVIGKRIQDQFEAEDVLQDVYVEFLEDYGVNSAIETVGAWLVTVAKNKVIDRFRRRKTQNNYAHSVESSTPAELNAATPENEWSRTWLRNAIVDALEELPPEQREVFVMHELEGKSFEEIAQETGVSVNTALSRKRYAILFLRKMLKEIYDELE